MTLVTYRSKFANSNSHLLLVRQRDYGKYSSDCFVEQGDIISFIS